MDIDTSNCSYPVLPRYFVSISGANSHDYIVGYQAIYSPTTTSFRIYAAPLKSWSNTLVLSASQTYAWDVNWFGISG